MLNQQIWQAGPVVYPLLVCSVLTAALIIERLIILLLYPPLRTTEREQKFVQNQIENTTSARGLLAGLQLLLNNQQAPKQLRDEVLCLWLQAERRKLFAHIRWLTMLGVISPLLGLLGTVLGIITMFQDVSQATGPVTPALLASGMWEAMVTTAQGITIAVPALIASHGFSIWGDQRIAAMTEVLNNCSIKLEQRLLGIEQARVKPTASPTPLKEQLA